MACSEPESRTAVSSTAGVKDDGNELEVDGGVCRVGVEDDGQHQARGQGWRSARGQQAAVVSGA
jgi:hypothetical protein